MKVIITFTFCCDHLWKRKFMALEKPEKLREFFVSYFVATLPLYFVIILLVMHDGGNYNIEDKCRKESGKCLGMP